MDVSRLYVHSPVVNIWVVFQFGAIMSKTATSICADICFHFSAGKHLGVERLDRMGVYI